MKVLHSVFILLPALALLSFSVPVTAFAHMTDKSMEHNTELNKRDTSPKELTADQQGETKQDRELTQKIRRAVVTDKSLSIDAHNVKIITTGGIVTLKGPVKSEVEKRAIEVMAAQIAGDGKVKSEIDIAPEKTGK